VQLLFAPELPRARLGLQRTRRLTLSSIASNLFTMRAGNRWGMKGLLFGGQSGSNHAWSGVLLSTP
jgi:hypothetical protein